MSIKYRQLIGLLIIFTFSLQEQTTDKLNGLIELIKVKIA